MDRPVRRGGFWWQADSTGTWYRWNGTKWDKKDSYQFAPPPSGPFSRVRESESDPLVVYALGLVAALVALAITALLVEDSSVAVVLAPITAVIGAFAGHAAGHSSALRAMRR